MIYVVAVITIKKFFYNNSKVELKQIIKIYIIS